MLNRLIIPAIAVLTLAACTAQKQTAQTKVPKTANTTVNSTYPVEGSAQNTIRLSEGQNIFLKDKQMNVTFKKVVQDSRCAMNARCIWAGNATIEIELMGAATRPQKFLLTIGDLRAGKVKSVNFNSYTVSLENLYPSNSTEMGFEQLKGKYVADISVK